MTASRLSIILVAIGLAVSCSTTMPSNTSVAATQTTVLSTINQAVTQSTPVVLTPGAFTSTYTCPAGGSITTTMNSSQPSDPTSPFAMTSRVSFNDCRSESVTLHGDPFLETSGTYAMVVNPDGSADVAMTSHMTGGIRFESSAGQGRAQYNCTQVMSMHFTSMTGGASLPSLTPSGSITWEQPIGSTPTTRSCGTAR